ncbi:hypothetical protein BD414DRAFT_508353 [Trametes punicea]|nr:hypothetical protein BD414DRAFT_508353 [Trametes punicea]
MKPPATRHHDRTGTAYLQTKADAIRRRVYERGLHFPEGYPLEVLAALADLRLSDEANSADVEEILCGCGTGRKAYDIGDFTEQAQSAEESSDSQNDTGDIDEGVGTQIVVEGSAIPVAQCTTRGTSSPIFAAKDAEHGTIKKIPADAYNFPIFAGDDVRLIRFEVCVQKAACHLSH